MQAKHKSQQFPLNPPSKALLSQIIKVWCSDSDFNNFVEFGHVVCRALTPANDLTSLQGLNFDMSCLEV